MDFLIEHAVAIAIVCGIAGAVYGLLLTRWVLSQPDGDERMKEIAAAIQEGAAAYLKRQYTTIAVRRRDRLRDHRRGGSLYRRASASRWRSAS